MKTLFITLSLVFSAMAFGQDDISKIISSGEVKPGRVCFDECKVKKKFLGVAGDKQDATERRSCVTCLSKYPELFTVRPEFLNDNGYFVELKSEAGEAKILMGEACYEECQPQKEFKVVGKTQDPLDNPKCAPCIRKNNEKYKFNLSILTEDEVKCAISSDRQYAFCQGDTYKLDHSINTLERAMGKDIPSKLNDNKKASEASKQ